MHGMGAVTCDIPLCWQGSEGVVLESTFGGMARTWWGWVENQCDRGM